MTTAWSSRSCYSEVRRCRWTWRSSLTPAAACERPAAGEEGRARARESVAGRDRAAIFEVKTTIEVAARLTADQNAIALALDRLYASGSSSIYAGVTCGAREFERERSTSCEMRQQALYSLSDGFDNSS